MPSANRELETVSMGAIAAQKKNQIGQFLAVPRDIALKLRIEASQKDSAMYATCKLLASRERSRKVLTARALLINLLGEGSQFDKGEVARVLRTLAGLGIANQNIDMKNRFIGIKDIKYELQAVGIAALSNEHIPLVTVAPETKQLVTAMPTRAQAQERQVSVTTGKGKGTIASITITSPNKTFTIDVSDELASRYVKQLLLGDD